MRSPTSQGGLPPGSSSTDPVTGACDGGKVLTVALPVEECYRIRSSDPGESAETLALAVSAWDSNVQAANNLDTPIQT